jgi:hypothetical protein
MASSAINVSNPVTNPTAAQLVQIAANIVTVLGPGSQQGRYIDLYDCVTDLAAAINCLAQALLTINNATASSVGTVNVRNAYNLGATATIPANINTAAV